MFKVRLKNPQIFTQIEKKLVQDIEEVLGTKDMLDEVGEFISDRVRYQARVSKPYSARGDFPELKDSTIKNRKYLAKHNATHDTYQAERSNLTITGQLLDSIKHTITGVGKILIGVTGTHQGYKLGSGGKTKPIKMDKLKGYLEDKDFVIFDDSINDNKTIVSRTKTIVLRYIRRALAIRNRLAK
jgi:phosphoribosylpyrophosphate synthetase